MNAGGALAAQRRPAAETPGGEGIAGGPRFSRGLLRPMGVLKTPPRGAGTMI